MAADVTELRATTVYVFGADPLCQAGMTAYLRDCAEVTLVPASRPDDAQVALVVVEAVDEAALRVLRALQRDGAPAVLLVVTEVDAAGVAAAVQAGAAGLLRRSELTQESLRRGIRSAAAGEGVLPPDLLGGLLDQVRQVQSAVLAPRGLTLAGISRRELDVLRLLSEGCDTREIALRLCYSERTVKTVIQDVTRRYGLRNRTHAVAYALRQGLI